MRLQPNPVRNLRTRMIPLLKSFFPATFKPEIAFLWLSGAMRRAHLSDLFNLPWKVFFCQSVSLVSSSSQAYYTRPLTISRHERQPYPHKDRRLYHNTDSSRQLCFNRFDVCHQALSPELFRYWSRWTAGGGGTQSHGFSLCSQTFQSITNSTELA